VGAPWAEQEPETKVDMPRVAPATPTESARFRSILSPDRSDAPRDEMRAAPDFFRDLSLDRVVAAITAGRREYDLAPFFHARLADPDAVAYRQEVMREMEDRAARQAVDSFAERMRTMRHRLAAIESPYPLESQRWHLGAVEVYVEAVERLARDLGDVDLTSRGLVAFRADLADHARSEAFHTLASEARAQAAALAAIRYCMLIHEGSVTVRNYDGEMDMGAAVEQTFRKFQQGAVKDYRQQLKDGLGLNHVEAQVLDRVALLNPDTFGALARYCERHADFVDPTIARFDREIQFYVAYLDYVGRFRRAGLPFCYPEVSDGRKDVVARATFDLALADTLVRDNATVVCNDFFLHGAERVLVVTGPNQSGKTTFARTFGQLHHLAGLGCPVPGRAARLFLCERLFTHFEREEDITNLRGKLEDDLVRIRRILDQATPADHVDSFFQMLRAELAFYIGCVNVQERLAALGEPTCFPRPVPAGQRALGCSGLYDPCLALQMRRRVVGNAVAGNGKRLVVVTGANQGGKSSFLRGVGLAQVMMQCGMFVAAESFEGELCTELVTHYKREEDATLKSGKLDEELARMSEIVDHLEPNAVILCNESFAATNEREGAEIARQVVSALLEKGVKIFFVTHLYTFARDFFERAVKHALFLRAERRPDGTRTFRLVEGEPLATSYGRDLYERIFASK
jgi:hypothetical protein